MAGVFTVLGLGILLWLGFWQVDRLAWKEALLARIDANMAAEPIPFDLSITGLENEYLQVCATGTFRHDRELYVIGSSIDGRGGVLIYTPLQMEGGVIIVNRGWVPNEFKDPTARAAGQVSGSVEVCGVLRRDREEGLFSLENNPALNRWFTPKVEPMADLAGVSNASEFFLDANADENPGGYPVGGQTFVNIANNHLGYAITWFGLALTLIGVFGFFVWSRTKKS